MNTIKKSNKKILFILCSIRSGSTLLKNMLDQHTDIFAPAEMHILPFDNLNDMELNFKNTTLSKGIIESIIKLKKCNEEEAQEYYEYFKSNDYTSQDIYDWFLSHSNETYLVDKSPTYCMNLQALQNAKKLNNDVRFIHLVRHPMAVIKSALNNNFDKLVRMINCNAARAIRSASAELKSDFVYFDKEKINASKHRGMITEGVWRDTNQNINEFLEGIESSRKLQIHYENLVDNPVAIMQTICQFLELDYQVKMNMSSEIFRYVKETVGDPNFFKRNKIKNQNVFSTNDLTDKDWEIDGETIDLAIKYKYLCWESEKMLGLLPTEKMFFEQKKHYNKYCLITTVESEFQSRFDERKLSRSLSELMIKNPNLSSVFVKSENQWKRKLVRDSQIQISRIFCKPDEDINERLDAYTKLWIKDIDITNGPLFTLFYVYQNKRITVRYVVHHLLMDGSAIQQFHKQLWAGYSSNNRSSALATNHKEINEFINFCEQTTGTKDLLEEIEFYPVFKHRKEIPNYASQEEVSFIVKKSDDLKDGFNFNELASALYLSLSKYSQNSQVTIAHRFHNRNSFGKNKKSLVAWIASDAPITLNVDQLPSDLIKSFKAEKRKVDQKEIAFNLANNQIAVHKLCPIRFNYIPLFINRKSEGMHFPEYQSSLSFDPRNEMDYMLDFVVRENSDQLEFIIRFSNTEFDKGFINEITQDWVDLLPSFQTSIFNTKTPVLA